MITDLPPSLYKYFSPERVSVISDQLLRYTQLGDFNDPFEGRPEITGLVTPNEAITVLDRVLPEEIQKTYDSLGPNIRKKISRCDFSAHVNERIQAERGAILKDMQSLTPMVASLLTKKLDEILGVLCLSEVPDSLLMWGHYGVGHTGFVLEFDSSHPYFHQQITGEDEFRHLRRVFYRKGRPSSLLTDMSGVEVFLVKSEHWAYEREWRIMRPLQDADKMIDKKPYSVHLYAYPIQSVKSIIIGARAADNTISLIREVVSKNSIYSHIRLRQAFLDASNFHLKIAEIV